MSPNEGPPSRGRSVAGARRGRPRTDRGSVTAELAVAMTGLVLVLSGLFAVAAVTLTQVRVTDAAGSGARAAARGEAPSAVQEVATRVAGPSATTTLGAAGDMVTVTVSKQVRLPLVGQPVLEVAASAVARVESMGSGP